jgi:hypothetical protein
MNIQIDSETGVVLTFLGLASLVGMLSGTILVLRPGWLAEFGKFANRWISTRDVERGLERTINFDKWFYQNARIGSALMLFGACWIIVYFTVFFDKARFANILSPVHASDLQDMHRFLNGFVAMALAGGVFAAIVSLFLLLRPSLLREFEKEANRWISTRRALYPLDIRHDGVDHYVLRHYRVVGMLLLFAGVFMLGILMFLLR